MTRLSSAIIGAILPASLWAGSTIENSGRRTPSRRPWTILPCRSTAGRLRGLYGAGRIPAMAGTDAAGHRMAHGAHPASSTGSSTLPAAGRRRCWPGCSASIWSSGRWCRSWLSANLQLDLVEDLALGREWQLGYWKHPPLPWWIADLAYRIVGHVNVVYVLGPLAVAVCFYAVWLLAREIVGAFEALIAVAALEAIHLYNFSAVKFAHDQMQLAVLGVDRLVLLARHRARPDARLDPRRRLSRRRVLVEICRVRAGGDARACPSARSVRAPAWRTPGPYLMAVAFVIVIAPNVWWLVHNDFLPLRYVDDRAIAATRWYHYIALPAALDRRPGALSAPGAGAAGVPLPAPPAGRGRGRSERPPSTAAISRRSRSGPSPSRP